MGALVFFRCLCMDEINFGVCVCADCFMNLLTCVHVDQEMPDVKIHMEQSTLYLDSFRP